MIWFACKQCGKTHGRPETTAGAMVFCDCGGGTIVPWESTIAEPPLESEPEAVPALTLQPIAFPAPRSQVPPLPPARSRKRLKLEPRDPAFCLNHQDVPREHACADCGEGFCPRCLVSFQEALLCGPCKNYRIKGLQRASPTPMLAIFSMLTALAAPLVLIFVPGRQSGVILWVLLALIPPGTAVALSVLALRAAAKQSPSGGRALAYTGLLGALVTSVLILFLAMYTPRVWT